MNGFLRGGGTPTLTVGPFLDETDGKTPETGLTIAAGDVYLSKNGGAFAAKNESSGGTHDASGFYGTPVDGTDLDSPGLLTLKVNASGALPLRHDYIVLPGVLYDALIGNELAEPSAIFSWPASPADILAYIGALSRNKVLVDGDSMNLRNDADDADIAAYALSDNGTTFTSGEGS